MPQASVRPAKTSDLDEVVRLWEELRTTGGRWGPQAPPVSVEALRRRLTDLADSDDHRVIVAVIDAEPVGVAVLSVVPLNALTDETTLQISFLHVRGDSRRKGVAKMLLDAAARQAVEHHAEFVSVSVFPQARESNRFFARLGFGAYSVQRVMPTALLQRRLAADSFGRRRLRPTRRRGRRSGPHSGPALSGR